MLLSSVHNNSVEE